jgi:hypothetical protein
MQKAPGFIPGAFSLFASANQTIDRVNSAQVPPSA